MSNIICAELIGNTAPLPISPAGRETCSVDCANRNWWRAEARCAGSDWSGVLALHVAVVAAWRRRHDPDYGSAP